MKVYRLHVREHHAGSTGYLFFSSKHIAENAKRQAAAGIGVEAVSMDGPHEIQLTKVGVLRALNHFAGHPNNG